MPSSKDDDGTQREKDLTNDKEKRIAGRNRSRTPSDEKTEKIKLTPEAVESFDALKHRKRSQICFEQTWPLYRDALKAISQYTHIPSDTLNNYVRTIGFLVLLGLLFPLNLCVTLFTSLASRIFNFLRGKSSSPNFNPNSKRILISGGMMTKALELCRIFHQDGHHVILIDEEINRFTGHRWSNSVRGFYIVPSPEKHPDEYIETLIKIVQKDKIDMFVPVTGPYHAHIDSQVKPILAKYGCITLHMDADDLALVDNKYTFTDQARSLGLSVPKSFYITSREQLLNFNFDNERRQYICKSILYDWLDRAVQTKLPLPTRKETMEYVNELPISEECPYILQEYITGEEYCTHGTCLDGQLTLFNCCPSSPWQINYKHVDQPEVLQWCTKLVRELNLTGHASFDFIISDDDGKPYGIECNPRVHSAITAFYNQSNLARAYFQPPLSTPIIPLASARETYWLPHELWRFFRNLRTPKKSLISLKRILSGKEAIWSWDDPLPFLLHYHVHIVYLLLDNLRPSMIRFFNKIDCCIGELA